MRKENDKTAEHGLGAAHRDTLRSRLACEAWRGIRGGGGGRLGIFGWTGAPVIVHGCNYAVIEVCIVRYR